MHAVKGMEIVNNHDADRLQILFDDIPDDKTRRKLKEHGWRWSPQDTAWQRKDTEAARWSIKHIFDIILEGCYA